MTGLENLDPQMKRQDTEAIGPFASGDYTIGRDLHAAAIRGEVIWSCRKNSSGPLAFVVDDGTGWPTEDEANKVQA